MIRITAIAVGQVQGVGYRYLVRGCAVESFTRLLWAPENLMIRVRNLFVTPGEATGEYVGFGVKW